MLDFRVFYVVFLVFLDPDDVTLRPWSRICIVTPKNPMSAGGSSRYTQFFNVQSWSCLLPSLEEALVIVGRTETETQT